MTASAAVTGVSAPCGSDEALQRTDSGAAASATGVAVDMAENCAGRVSTIPVVLPPPSIPTGQMAAIRVQSPRRSAAARANGTFFAIMATDVPSTMRAVRLHEFGVENLRIEEVPVPRPQPGEVLVQMKASPVNPSDLSYIQVREPTAAPATLAATRCCARNCMHC